MSVQGPHADHSLHPTVVITTASVGTSHGTFVVAIERSMLSSNSPSASSTSPSSVGTSDGTPVGTSHGTSVAASSIY